MFRDYDVSADEALVTTKVVETVIPGKRKVNDVATEAHFPLTPPSTVKSEIVSLELKVERDEMSTEINENFVRRSKRQKVHKHHGELILRLK